MQLASMAMDPKKRFDFRQVLAVVAAQAVAVRLNGLVKLPQGVEGDVAAMWQVAYCKGHRRCI